MKSETLNCPIHGEYVVGARPKQRRGFACMSKERQREIARKGGLAMPASAKSFSKDRDLAASAGRKGGQASHGGGRHPRANP